ncbi:MAG TPA: hypothetical protein V6D15_04370 [Oculatellaceae cyanobacterium]|jgi:hypothetical protein
MTTELLAALQQMTTEERLEIIETASRLIREEIQEQEKLKTEKKRRLALAAESAISDYMPGGALHDLWSYDSEDYDNPENEYLTEGIKANA